MTTPRGGISGYSLQSCAFYVAMFLFGFLCVAPVLIVLAWSHA